MQCFAQAEAAASETLLVLHRVKGRGNEVRLRHLVGQRLADLAASIEPDGPFGPEGKAAFCALEEFRKYEGLRTVLGHGVAKVTLERGGSWVLILRHVSITKQSESRSVQVFDQTEAEMVFTDLRKKSRQTCSALGNLRRLFEAPSSKPLAK
jgi:hypothetical protein